MKPPVRRWEYRVTWQRFGNKRKSKRYASMKPVNRLIGLMTSEEPWLFVPGYERKTPDDLACCSGRECGCGGETVRQKFLGERKNMPSLVWLKVECREVPPWTLSAERKFDPPYSEGRSYQEQLGGADA